MLHRLNGLSDPTISQDVTLALRRLARGRSPPPHWARGLVYAELRRVLVAMLRTFVGQKDVAMLALGY